MNNKLSARKEDETKPVNNVDTSGSVLLVCVLVSGTVLSVSVFILEVFHVYYKKKTNVIFRKLTQARTFKKVLTKEKKECLNVSIET